jgi:predicted nuclease of predicted toxin-antitoxin system
MRLLMDSCMWNPTTNALRKAGHDVDSVSEWPADPGDAAILQRAFAESRVLVTLDNDFGELAVRLRLPHAGMIRLQSIVVDDEAAACLAVIAVAEAELLHGAIVTVTPQRIRIRLSRPLGDE